LDRVTIGAADFLAHVDPVAVAPRREFRQKPLAGIDFELTALGHFGLDIADRSTSLSAKTSHPISRARAYFTENSGRRGVAARLRSIRRGLWQPSRGLVVFARGAIRGTVVLLDPIKHLAPMPVK
jgi:hypothetical protein